jgi:hypothetical protein
MYRVTKLNAPNWLRPRKSNKYGQERQCSIGNPIENIRFRPT